MVDLIKGLSPGNPLSGDESLRIVQDENQVQVPYRELIASWVASRNGQLEIHEFVKGLEVSTSEFLVRFENNIYSPAEGATPFVTGFSFNPAQWEIVDSVRPQQIEYKGRTIYERLAEKISILDFGAKPVAAYSESMQNDRNAWNLAQAAAGVNGVVHFPAIPGAAETHYWIGGGLVYFHNCYSSADPGVIIHLAEVSNDVAYPRRNLTPITFSRRYPGGTFTYGAVLSRTDRLDEYLASPAALMASVESGRHFRDRISLSTFNPIRIAAFASSAYTEDGAGMNSQASTSVNWTDATAAGTDHQGIMCKGPTPGITYEFLLDIPNTNGVSGTYNVVLGRNGNHHRWEFTLGDSTVRFYNGDTLVSSFTVANLMDRISGDVGCSRVAVRILQSNIAELVINDVVYDAQATPSALRYVAFVASPTIRQYAALKYHNQSDRTLYASGRPLNILVIGDSQTAGANASATWPRILEQMAQHLPGIGKLSVTNMAVSGTSTGYWATQIASINCAPYDRVLVMLGVNNNQAAAQAGLSAFLSNIVTINSKIVADGSRPIWGMNTRYTTAELSGGGGATTNHGIFARYSAVMKDRCVTDGYELAETIEAFGNNAGANGSFTGDISPSWHTDNIHPNGHGQIAIAAAFSAALSRDITAKYKVPKLRAGSLTPAAPWVVNTPLTNGYLRWAIRDGVLYLRGKVRRDPGSSAPVANTTIATLPSFIPISAPADFIVRTQGGVTNAWCELTINQNGTIVAGPNALTDMVDITVSMIL